MAIGMKLKLSIVTLFVLTAAAVGPDVLAVDDIVIAGRWSRSATAIMAITMAAPTAKPVARFVILELTWELLNDGAGQGAHQHFQMVG